MSGELNTGGGTTGQASLEAFANDFNALDFFIRQVVANKAFSGLVKIVNVHGGGVGAAPTVDAQPLVDQVDGLGNRTPHGIVYGLTCFRLQGGNGACILDPMVGDTGHAIICDRDISNVKANAGGQSAPGSFRTNSWSDGCYYGTILGDTPSRYVRMSSSGTQIVDPTQIQLTVGGFGITITASGTTIDGKMFLPHVHTLVQTGSSDSGPVGP